MKICRSLVCHPAAPAAAVLALRIEIEIHPNGILAFGYELTAQLQQLVIPAPLPPIMADNLWRHTCFEAFIAIEEDAGYYEFNFSPSGQWAAYAFNDYRKPRQWKISQPPCIKINRTADRFRLSSAISTGDLPPNPAKKLFQLNLTAVIEAQDGSHSYWALHHPSPFPDFHDRRGFTQHLEAPFTPSSESLT
ncbi:MAG: DOMON-like domain-containing protein [Gammaproteobacteria bacterium]